MVTLAPRGIIYDRERNPLVKNIPSLDVVITLADFPKDEEAQDKIYKKLGSILKKKPTEIKKIIEEKKSTTFEPILVIENIDYNAASVIETHSEEYPGISIGKNPIREYLYKDLLSHILGYTGRISKEELDKKEDEKAREKYAVNDFIGKTGVELSYEDYLKGINGRQIVEVDALGKIVKELSAQEEAQPQAGENLVLTIDSELQKVMTSALSRGMKKANSQKGVAVALNPQNGEILGMVSLPSFDNNLFAQGISSNQLLSLYKDKNQPLFNRAISGTYPSGSIIKPVTAAAGLEEKIISTATTIFCSGVLLVPHQYNPSFVYHFLCWKRSGHGSINVIKAIAQSCDVFFYTVGGGFENFKGLGVSKLAEYFKSFGLGNKSDIDLPGEVAGLVPTPEWKKEAKPKESWYKGDTYHMAVGQGDLLVTPLQAVNFTATIANGGTLYQPHVLKQVIDNNGKVIENVKSKEIRKNFISKNNLDIVRWGMRQTVASGTARSLNSLPVPVSGKTGTAQFGPGNLKEHAWFTAFAPFDNPQIALVVLVEGGGEGSSTAVPITKEILSWYFSKYKF